MHITKEYLEQNGAMKGHRSIPGNAWTRKMYVYIY